MVCPSGPLVCPSFYSVQVRNLPGGATLLEVGLENARKEPLTVTEVRFDPAPHLTVTPILAPPIAAATTVPAAAAAGAAGDRAGEAGVSGRGGAAAGGGAELSSGLGPGPLAGLIAGLQPLRANGGAPRLPALFRAALFQEPVVTPPRDPPAPLRPIHECSPTTPCCVCVSPNRRGSKLPLPHHPLAAAAPGGGGAGGRSWRAASQGRVGGRG